MVSTTPSTSVGTQAISRTLAVLTLFRESEGDLGISDIARHLSLSVSTVHRIVRALVDDGFLESRRTQRAVHARPVRGAARPCGDPPTRPGPCEDSDRAGPRRIGRIGQPGRTRRPGDGGGRQRGVPSSSCGYPRHPATDCQSTPPAWVRRRYLTEPDPSRRRSPPWTCRFHGSPRTRSPR